MTLATFNHLDKAEALQKRLEQAGINAVIHDESRLQRFGFMTDPIAARKVAVEPKDFEGAKRLLNDWDKAEGLLRDAVRCPQCKSSRIEYPQFTRKFITPMVVELFIVIGLFPKEFYCEDCHYTWPKDQTIESEKDLLGWPVSHAQDSSGAANTRDADRRQ
jgi:hypothetical protein